MWAGISLRFLFCLRFFSSTELTTLAQKPMSHRRESPTEGPEAHYSDFRELLDFFCEITEPFLRCLCLYKHKLQPQSVIRSLLPQLPEDFAGSSTYLLAFLTSLIYDIFGCFHFHCKTFFCYHGISPQRSI